MNEQTIYALGFFDGVHRGHQTLLQACRQLATGKGCLAGAITFSDPPEALIRGAAPELINTPHDRALLLTEVGRMDTVVTLPFDKSMMEMPYRDFFGMMVEKYHAAGFVCGADFRFGHRGQGTSRLLQQMCQEAGMPCQVLTKLQDSGGDISSSRIRQLLKEGQTEQANLLLGHPHIFTGRVISGRQLGRTIGVPTANLCLPEGLDCLRHGVYASQVCVNGKNYLAVTNVGLRPTVKGEGVNMEAFLLDFSGNLYGEELRLAFYKYLRPEHKFSSLEELQGEIIKNVQQTRDFFKKSK